jgi:hypothetical protein
LCQGGRPDQAPRALLWLYRWRAFWLERSYKLLRKTAPAAQNSAFSEGEGLIFIQGFWRAGTTLLHELLAEMPECAVPRTWQCMDPASLLLPSGRPAGGEAMQRPMDQVMISVDSPQEDEFALLAMGVPSVYRGFLDPRRLPELTSLLQPRYWLEADPAWLKTLEAFLSWCAEPGKTQLVVKSPNHIYRSPALAAFYPKARFVWILRDPEELWRSNLKMWRAMIAHYGLWKERNQELEHFLDAALTAYADLLEAMLHGGDFRSQPVFSYEALVRDPETVLPALLDRLGFGPWESLDGALRSRLLAKPVRGEAKPQPPLSGPSGLIMRIRVLHEETLHSFGIHATSLPA